MRPILDLRGLNKHLRQFKFKMLTCDGLLRTVRKGDHFTSIDIKDAFRQQGIRISTYRDDWRLYDDTPQQVVLHT